LEKIQGKHEQKEKGRFILPSVTAHAAVSVAAGIASPLGMFRIKPIKSKFRHKLSIHANFGQF
jgi:hypothetical protein